MGWIVTLTISGQYVVRISGVLDRWEKEIKIPVHPGGIVEISDHRGDPPATTDPMCRPAEGDQELH